MVATAASGDIRDVPPHFRAGWQANNEGMTTKSFAVIRFCRSAHSEFGAYDLRSTMHKFRSLTLVRAQHSAARSNIPKANHASATLRGGAVLRAGDDLRPYPN